MPERACVPGVARAQLTAVDHEVFTDMAAPQTALRKLGIQHGDMVFMHYPFERAVAPSVHRSAFETRPFGTDTCCVAPVCLPRLVKATLAHWQMGWSAFACATVCQIAHLRMCDMSPV